LVENDASRLREPGMGGKLPVRSRTTRKIARIASCGFVIEYKLQIGKLWQPCGELAKSRPFLICAHPLRIKNSSEMGTDESGGHGAELAQGAAISELGRLKWCSEEARPVEADGFNVFS
jgi:hypothetical protein